MHDAKFVQVLHAADDLLEVLACFGFFQFLFLDNVVEEFAATHELHYQEQLLGCLNDFEELDDVWVSDELKNVDFSSDPLHISLTRDLALFEYFDRNLESEGVNRDSK